LRHTFSEKFNGSTSHPPQLLPYINAELKWFQVKSEDKMTKYSNLNTRHILATKHTSHKDIKQTMK